MATMIEYEDGKYRVFIPTRCPSTDGYVVQERKRSILDKLFRKEGRWVPACPEIEAKIKSMTEELNPVSFTFGCDMPR